MKHLLRSALFALILTIGFSPTLTTEASALDAVPYVLASVDAQDKVPNPDATAHNVTN